MLGKQRQKSNFVKHFSLRSNGFVVLFDFAKQLIANALMINCRAGFCQLLSIFFMNKSPLFRTFSSLEKHERRQLRKFVRSSFFNQREDVVRLFDHLDKQMDNGGHQLSKAQVFAKVFPDEPYDDSRLRHAMSFLMQCIREYLIWSEVGRSEFERQLYLARSLRRRGIEDQFQRTLDRAEVEASQLLNADRHLQLFQLQSERYHAAIRQQRRGEMGLQRLANEFANYFAANLLRQACGIATHQSMTKQAYDIPLLAEVLAKVEAGEFADIPAVQLYFHAYLAQQTLENEQHFRALRALLEKHWRDFPTTEARDLFLLAINFCIKKLNSGVADFRRDVFDLYRSGLEKEVLLTEGVISPFTYNNVLNSALLVDEWDWAAGFLEKFKPRLPEAERENTYHFNLANLFFRKKDYERAMDLLRQVEFKDKLHNLDARRMLLRMYYETEALDALESLLDSFEIYIRRQKDLGYHGENYLNLIRLTRKLLQLTRTDKDAREKLATEIMQTKSLAEREWLLEKIKEAL